MAATSKPVRNKMKSGQTKGKATNYTQKTEHSPSGSLKKFKKIQKHVDKAQKMPTKLFSPGAKERIEAKVNKKDSLVKKAPKSLRKHIVR